MRKKITEGFDTRNQGQHKASALPKFGVATSVYLSPLFSSEYRQLCEERYGVSGSFRLNELMLKDLAEMKGQTLPSHTNISALEMRVANLIARGKKYQGVSGQAWRLQRP